MNLEQLRSRKAQIEAAIAERTARMSKTQARRWSSDARNDLVYELSVVGAKITDLEKRAAQAAHNWRNDPATDRQREYLVALGVQLERNMTKGRASDLIEAAKANELGSIGGWRHDGSN